MKAGYTRDVMNEIPLYWMSPDTLQSECRIVSANQISAPDSQPEQAGWNLIIENSPFYPGGGGQPADRGSIAGFNLLEMSRSEGSVLHRIQAGGTFSPGDMVSCVVDADFRRDSRQQHSGQHLLSAALSAEGLDTISVHLGADYCGIEVDASKVCSGTIRRVLEHCEQLIREDRPIHSRLLKYEEAAGTSLRRPLSDHADAAAEKAIPVRVVEIDNMDAVGCGGVHLTRTGDIRGILFEGEEKIRGHVRLKWIIGDRVFNQAGQQSEILRELSRLLSTESGELGRRVEALLNESRESGSRLDDAEKALGALYCEQAAGESEVVALDIGGASRRISGALEAASREGIRAGLFLGETDPEGRRLWGIYLADSEKNRYTAIQNSLIFPAGGKGGGRPPTWRGVISGQSENLLRQFLDLMKR